MDAAVEDEAAGMRSSLISITKAVNALSITDSTPVEIGFPSRGRRFMRLSHSTLSKSHGLAIRGKTRALLARPAFQGGEGPPDQG